MRSIRIERILVALAALALVVWGLGAKNEKLRIGVVDLDHAIASTKSGMAAREEFERKKRDADAQMIPLMERYKELMGEFEAKKFVLSDDARFQKQLDMAELQNQIENKRKQVLGQLQVDRERLIAPLRNKMLEIVDEVGRSEDFSLILLRNAPGLMYSREALDVTELIIEKFNKKG